MIKSRLKVILAQREVANTPPFTISDVASATGLSRQTLYNLANNTTTRYDASVLDALCRVFKVQVGDLLVYLPDEEEG